MIISEDHDENSAEMMKMALRIHYKK